MANEGLSFVIPIVELKAVQERSVTLTHRTASPRAVCSHINVHPDHGVPQAVTHACRDNGRGGRIVYNRLLLDLHIRRVLDSV